MRLTFFMLADLRSGRGTENVLFNLLKHKPSHVEVTIIETDFLGNARISETDVIQLTRGCKIIQIHRHIYPMNDRTLIKRIYVNLILRPFYRDLKEAKSKHLLEQIQNTDIVYLFLNEYSIFFKDASIPVIGSDHTFKMGDFTDEKDLTRKLFSNFIYRLYFKNISGLHYFPQDRIKFEKLKRDWHLKYNFELSSAVDTNFFYPELRKVNAKLKFLFVAALDYSKGLDILIPVIEKIGYNDTIEFHIAGSGPVESEIQKIKNIQYHGVLSNEELAMLYRVCDIFIYPSHNDQYPTVVTQALSSGLYVLAGDFFKGIFDDFSKYLEYVPMNVESFYKRINEIINDRKTIEHDKQEEYEYVRNNYDWSIIAKKFYDNMENIYKEFYHDRNKQDDFRD